MHLIAKEMFIYIDEYICGIHEMMSIDDIITCHQDIEIKYKDSQKKEVWATTIVIHNQ